MERWYKVYTLYDFCHTLTEDKGHISGVKLGNFTNLLIIENTYLGNINAVCFQNKWLNCCVVGRQLAQSVPFTFF